MKLSIYISEKGLVTSHVARQMGVSRQQLDQYCNDRFPNLKTTLRIAEAMTALGVPTTVGDISKALMQSVD